MPGNVSGQSLHSRVQSSPGLAAAGSAHPHACTASTSGTQQLPASCRRQPVPSTWQEAAASTGPLGEALLAQITLVIQPWLSGSPEGRAVTSQEGEQAAADGAQGRGQPLLSVPSRAVDPRGLGATTPWLKETEAPRVPSSSQLLDPPGSKSALEPGVRHGASCLDKLLALLVPQPGHEPTPWSRVLPREHPGCWHQWSLPCRWIMPKCCTTSGQGWPFPPACCSCSSSPSSPTGWPKPVDSTGLATYVAFSLLWPSSLLSSVSF